MMEVHEWISVLSKTNETGSEPTGRRRQKQGSWKWSRHHMGLRKEMENETTKQKHWDVFYYSGNGVVWRWHKGKLLPLAPSSCSLLYRLRHSSLCQAASQRAGHAMPTHALAVKDVPLETCPLTNAI